MPETSFMDDVIFPVHISWGSAGGPDWPAEIFELASGHEQRNTTWSAPLRYYDARYGVRDHDELYEILKLYHAAMGRLRGFRLLDWTDYRSGPPKQAPTAMDQEIGTGDGETAVFELSKSYQVGVNAFTRRIHKPYGAILVAVDGTPKTVDEDYIIAMDTGVVTFLEGSEPGVDEAVTWGGQFHVPVRFDGRMDQIAVRGPIGDIPSIPLKELRL